MHQLFFSFFLSFSLARLLYTNFFLSVSFIFFAVLVFSFIQSSVCLCLSHEGILPPPDNRGFCFLIVIFFSFVFIFHSLEKKMPAEVRLWFIHISFFVTCVFFSFLSVSLLLLKHHQVTSHFIFCCCFFWPPN